MEPLEPFERLEEDYYLGGRDGWYSDGENRDSESSDDDEFRKKLSRLAGVRQKCCSSHGKAQEKPQKKDEFESDMDDDLDEQFVTHASQFMASTSSKVASSSVVAQEEGKDAEKGGKAEQTDEEMPDLVSDPEEQPEANKNESASKGRSSGLLVSKPGMSRTKPKRVTIKDEPDIIEDSSCSKRTCEDGEKTVRSAFDDEDNLLRKAAKKVKNDVAQCLPDFYDPDEDEDNERWVRQHRERLKIIAPCSEKTSKKDGKEKDWEEDAKNYDDGKTDAVLSCPACMSLLTRDCQRHELYKNQYRAVFVENCNVITDKLLFLPPTESKRSKKARKKKAADSGPKPNEYVDPGDLSSIPKEDLFHPVQCSICSLNVGVFDHDEIYHFFDVLTGYA